MQKEQKKIEGFTLIELTISLFIISIISYSSYFLLSNFLNYQNFIKQRYENLSEIQTALKIINEDFSAIIARPIRVDKKNLKSIVYKSKEEGDEIEFSRAGVSTSDLQEKTDLMRLKYVVKDGVLIRHYWNILDRTKESKFFEQNLINKIEKIDISFFYTSDDDEVEIFAQNKIFTKKIIDGRNPDAFLINIYHPSYGKVSYVIN